MTKQDRMYLYESGFEQAVILSFCQRMENLLWFDNNKMLCHNLRLYANYKSMNLIVLMEKITF